MSAVSTARISLKFDIGDLYENVKKPPNLVKIGQISGTLHRDLRTFYCCKSHKCAAKALLCNAQYFYIVDSDVWLNNTHIKHCCVSTATVVTRTHHNVTLHEHCLVL
jgi:hypothetical protein